jgi:AbrB family looped-hinge helix DNA binding protein
MVDIRRIIEVEESRVQRFAVTVTAKGQVTLPAEFRRAINAVAGDRLSLVVGDDGSAVLRKDTDDLCSMQVIARRARDAAGRAEAGTGADPVGDYLVAEDERTKSGR